MERRDFFISYTKRDRAWAVWIARVLKDNGYTVYSQATDIKPGDNFIGKMNAFLKNSGNFIAIWSKAYYESPYCTIELQAAFHAWIQKRKQCVLIVRVDSYPVEPLYDALVNVDLSKPDKAESLEEKLVNAVHSVPEPTPKKDIEKPPQPTVPPPIEPHKPNPDRKEQKSVRVSVSLFAAGLIIGTFLGIVILLKTPGLYAAALTLQGDFHYIQEHYDEALENYKQAAYQGNAAALNQMGYFYHFGLGVSVNYAKARDYYEQAAVKGNADALYSLGTLYHDGFGVSVNYAKARDYYEQAAVKNKKYMYGLAWLYEHGHGVVMNYKTALDYYQQAADAGNKDARAKAAELRAKLDGESE